MSRIVLVDNSLSVMMASPTNCILIPDYFDDDKDIQLKRNAPPPVLVLLCRRCSLPQPLTTARDPLLTDRCPTADLADVLAHLSTLDDVRSFLESKFRIRSQLSPLPAHLPCPLSPASPNLTNSDMPSRTHGVSVGTACSSKVTWRCWRSSACRAKPRK